MHENIEACLDRLFSSVPAVRNYINKKISATIIKFFKNGKN